MTGESQRLDRWLWFTRFFKSRSLATRFCVSGRLRVNRTVVSKAHQPLRIGDVLTFPLGPHIRVIRVSGLGTRRGPAIEARGLYEDLEPPGPAAQGQAFDKGPVARRERGAGRPTKAERRATERFKDWG